MSTAYTFEYEDVVAGLLGAEITHPRPLTNLATQGLAAIRVQLQGRPGTGGRSSGSRADLAVVVAQGLSDVHAAYGALDTLDSTRQRVLVIEELWPGDLPLAGHERSFLRRFDLVAVGLQATVAPLGDELGVPTVYLPPAVDALAACAGPQPDRSIAMHTMGRRIEALHDRLLARARRTGEQYLYSTWSGNPRVRDHRAHRENLRGRIRRSRYFTVQIARFNDPERVGEAAEIGFRYAEGAAGGAILIGNRPHGPTWDELFGWEDAVIEVRDDGEDVDERLDELDADPARRRRIELANIRGSLAQHDIAHRVRFLLEVLDLPTTDALERRLAELATRRDELA